MDRRLGYSFLHHPAPNPPGIAPPVIGATCAAPTTQWIAVSHPPPAGRAASWRRTGHRRAAWVPDDVGTSRWHRIAAKPISLFQELVRALGTAIEPSQRPGQTASGRANAGPGKPESSTAAESAVEHEVRPPSSWRSHEAEQW